jgi:phage gp36-like protein
MFYCDADDVRRLLSSAGAMSFADHDQNGVEDPGVLDDCIGQATQEIDFCLHERYEPDQLVLSAIVNRWATNLACYFLCQRRGNPVPEPIQRECDRILFEENSALNEIRRGNRWLPGLEPNRGQAPSFANMTIDRRFRRPQKVNWDSERFNTSKRAPRAY